MTSAHVPGERENGLDDTPNVDPDLNREEMAGGDTRERGTEGRRGRHADAARNAEDDGEYTDNDPLNEKPPAPIPGEFTDSDIPGEVDPADAPGRAAQIDGEFTDSDIPGEVDPATAPGRADQDTGEYTDSDLSNTDRSNTDRTNPDRTDRDLPDARR